MGASAPAFSWRLPQRSWIARGDDRRVLSIRGAKRRGQRRREFLAGRVSIVLRGCERLTTTASTCAVTFEFRMRGAGTVLCARFIRDAIDPSSWNGVVPVSISYRIMPTAYRSLWLPTSPPVSCSGEQ
jgi:hypothetical protein